MSLSGTDYSSCAFDVMGNLEGECAPLTQSGHNLKEEQLGLWEEINLLKIPLAASFSKMREVISSGVKDFTNHPSFASFSLIFDMGEHLGLPWKTLATALCLLWRYVKAQLQKKNPPSSSPPRHVPFPSPITPVQDFNTYFQSLPPKDLHVLSYACLLLASKAEETLFSLRILNELHDNYLVVRGEAPSSMNGTGGESMTTLPTAPWRLYDKDRPFDKDWLTSKVKEQEVALLSDLGFNLTVRHLIYPRLFQIMNTLFIKPKLQEQAICLANFCLFSSVILLDRPCLLAVTIVYLVVRSNNETVIILPSLLPPGSSPPRYWWSLFNVCSSNLQIIAQKIIDLLNSLQMTESLLGEDQTPCDNNLLCPTNENDILELRGGVASPRPLLPNTTSGVPPLVDSDEPPTEQSFPPCRNISEFVKEKKVSEGAYGMVFVARDTRTGEVVAVKKMKKTVSRSGFPYFMLREILFLFRLNHPNIVNGRTMAIDYKGKEATFFIVMEFVATDMLSLVKFQASIPREQRVRLSQVKSALYQLLCGLHNMHSQGLLHRDLKLANLLMHNDGSLKVGDLGSIRDLGRTTLKLTTQVVTLWYRAPELLMGDTNYSYSIDIWSLGCLFVELMSLKPLFPGTSELETTVKIFRLLGRPSSQVWKDCYARLPLAAQVREYSSGFPHSSSLGKIVSFLSPNGHDFLNSALSLDPSQRITTAEALKHPFWTERPLPQPILLEKIGMVSYFDEAQLEMEAEVLSCGVGQDSTKERFKKFEQYAKKDE